MLFLRRVGFLAEIQELGTVQADAFAAALNAMTDLVRKLDVGVQENAHLVAGFGRQIAE